MPDYSDTRIQVRRGSSAEWAAANTVLASGEPGYDHGSGVLKVGNGVTGWNSLATVGGGGGGGGISNVVEDTTPQLGGNLDMNSKDLTGTGDVILTGSGMFAYPDGKCGLVVTDTLGSGLHIGDCALDASSAYAGIKHSDHGTNDYMIISNGVTTFLSAVNNGAVILRGGGNDANSEIQVKDVGVGAVGIIFNEAGSDRDIRMEGASEANLFRLDASEDSIGIKTAVPSHSLSVSGTLNANEVFVSGDPAVKSSASSALASGSLNVSGVTNMVVTDLAGYSGIAVPDNNTVYFIV